VIVHKLVIAWPDRPYIDFYANCYHVELKDKDGNLIFQRGFDTNNRLGDNWLDQKHRKITNALRDLENALLAAVDSEPI